MSTMNIANANVSRLVVADNDFGFQLLAQLITQDTDKNVFVSSFSIAIALAMTLNGAKGTTQQTMADTLGVAGMSLQEINEAHAALRHILTNPDPQVQFVIANSLWARNDIPFNSEFMQRNQDFYEAEVTNLDFTMPSALPTINGWVKQKTSNKIDKLVKPGDLGGDTILLLINAIYFKGMWHVPFNKANTKEGTFNLPNGQHKHPLMMCQSGWYNYYESQNFQAVSLPYGTGRIRMYIFLPVTGATLHEFQKELNRRNWDKWMSQFCEMEGEITLPRFKVEYEAKLSEVLVSLGMGAAFQPTANFQGISPGPLWISEVRHKTFVEVNEEGTEAAASTAVVMSKGMVGKFNFVVDRPFFIAICDNETGALLFMRYVVEPM